MSLNQKSLFFLILFFPFLSVCSDYQAQVGSDQLISSFQLARVSSPDEKLIKVEREKADARYLHKYVVTVTVAVGAIIAVYLAYQVREAAFARDAERIAKAAEAQVLLQNQKLFATWLAQQAVTPNASIPADFKLLFVPTAVATGSVLAPTKTPGWAEWVACGAKSFAWGTSKFAADSVLLIASGTVVNGFYNYAVSQISQTHADETVLWYAYEKTKMPNLFNDLKLYATDYDLYATLLSAQIFNQDAQLHLQAFVQDLLGAVNTHIKNEIFADQGYFGFLVNAMKKKYVRKSIELEKLNDYIVPSIAKHNRALVEEQVSILFTTDVNRRSDIALMCNLLSQEMEKLTAFIALRGGLAKKARIEDMVTTYNAFLAHMEKLLNATPNELEKCSKADCGMFTSIYEYEKLFSEQINFLHRYCKLNS